MAKGQKKLIWNTFDLDRLLQQKKASVEIGPYQLQDWMDWLIQHTQRQVTREDIIKAVNGYELNYNW